MITIQVSGNLIADATVKNIQGKEVINFTIASNYKNDLTFINCSIWNKPELAEYFFKGRAISVNGALKLRSYVAADGGFKTALNVSVNTFQLFGKNKTKEQQPEPIQEQPAATENNPEPLPF